MKERRKEQRLGAVAAWLIRIIGVTLRIHIEDRARLLDSTYRQPMIWTFWHNRMFVIPLLRLRVPHRTGAVLTSASRDGEIIAAVMASFGLKCVRGSSSRRGAAALMELADTLSAREDVAVTPDGPRGPRYQLGQGVIFLARQTGAPILPIHVRYTRMLRLKSWDHFRIPLPFSQVKIICDTPVFISPTSDPEAERERVERIMNPVPR